MTHALMGLAQGKVVMVLEGGYNLSAISHSFAACTSVLLGDPPRMLGRVFPTKRASRAIRVKLQPLLVSLWTNHLSVCLSVCVKSGFTVHLVDVCLFCMCVCVCVCVCVKCRIRNVTTVDSGRVVHKRATSSYGNSNCLAQTDRLLKTRKTMIKTTGRLKRRQHACMHAYIHHYATPTLKYKS